MTTYIPTDPLSRIKQAALAATLMNLNGTIWGFALYKAAKEYDVDEKEVARRCGRLDKQWTAGRDQQFK